jgi:uncharacterized repeat protein (TIGR01451 family)
MIGRGSRRAAVQMVVLAAALVAVGSAGATTIGTTTLPKGATMPVCTTGSTTEVISVSNDSSYSYVVPVGGGTLTSWSFNTKGATAGTPYTLLVAQPENGGDTIIGTDAETVPSSGAAVASFKLADPIAVQAGDVIGIVDNPKSEVGCLFKGSSVPPAEVAGYGVAADTTGNTFNISTQVSHELPNVSATITQSNNIAITQTAEPTSIVQGDDGVFVLKVTSAGPSSSAVTVTDTLPSGLTAVSGSAGTGTCSTSGQKVTCTVPGAPASIAVVAKSSRTGTFTNAATATGPLYDPSTANNTAKATLQVAAG